jgi:hypothetical protein
MKTDAALLLFLALGTSILSIPLNQQTIAIAEVRHAQK